MVTKVDKREWEFDQQTIKVKTIGVYFSMIGKWIKRAVVALVERWQKPATKN